MTVSLGAAPAPSNFPGGFANGITVQNLPILNAYGGKVFWLNNSAPGNSDSNHGTYSRPFASLQGVMNAAVLGGNNNPSAGRGDIIMVGPGHSETISSATALNVSVSGLSIVGVGDGGLRPTFTLNTAATATITVSAANVSFTNILFIANFANIAALFTLTTATDFHLYGCEFRDTSSILNFVNIVQTDTTANHADGLSILNSAFLGLGAQSATCLINAQANINRMYLQSNYVTHKATSAAGLMQIVNGSNVTNMQCAENIVNLPSCTGAVILISTNQTTNTGFLRNNLVQANDDSGEKLCTASSGFLYYNNYFSYTADTSGFLLPSAGS